MPIRSRKVKFVKYARAPCLIGGTELRSSAYIVPRHNNYPIISRTPLSTPAAIRWAYTTAHSPFRVDVHHHLPRARARAASIKVKSFRP